MIRVWLDTDIGDDIDDAVAIWCAARHPEIQLVGVSTVFGHVEARAWLAQELLTRLGVSGIPVLPGATTPLGAQETKRDLGSYMRLAPAIPFPASEHDRARVGAIAAAMQKVAAGQGPGASPRASLPGPPPRGDGFHLVTVGAMTNAACLLQDHPALAARWESVTCMAGRLEGDAEWNVRCDPAAARLVVERLHPRLVGLEASSYTLPRSRVEALLDPSQPAASFLLACYQAYRTNADWVESETAPLTLFDPISLLSLVCPEAFDLQHVKVLIEKDGRQRLTDDGAELEYAMSSDWGRLRPLIEGLLGGSP